jgi:hypothetical protein
MGTSPAAHPLNNFTQFFLNTKGCSMPKLNFTEAGWERIERDTQAWWEGELNRPLVYLAVTDPLPDPKPYAYLTNYPLEIPADQVVDRYEPFLNATHFYADAFGSILAPASPLVSWAPK